MTAALSVLVPLMAGQLCFTPPEQTAGWKRVDVPSDLPALAAPKDVQQFRVGEAAWLLERDPAAYQGMNREHAGRTTYRFRLPREARRMDLQFQESLRGAKVDAVVTATDRPFTLIDGRRYPDRDVSVEWGIQGVQWLEVTVRHHLRPVPVVASWTAARWVDPGGELDIPPEFRATRSLYYLHPGGRTVELCHLPGQMPTVDRGSLVGMPVSVTRRKGS